VMLELAMADWWDRDDAVRGKGGSGFADKKVQHLYEVLCERLWHAGSTAGRAFTPALPVPPPAPTTTPGLTNDERVRALYHTEGFARNGWIDLRDAGLVDVFATAERIALWLKTGERTKPLTPASTSTAPAHTHDWIESAFPGKELCARQQCHAIREVTP
jgi:hypothetical protein